MGQDLLRNVYTFWGARGGTGKTALACNTAVHLGMVADRKTLLLDANMSGGHVGLHMGIDTEAPILSLARVHQKNGGLTAHDLQEHVVSWRTGANVDILAGIRRVEQAGEESLRGEQGQSFIERLLAVANWAYDFVVVDTGTSFNNPIHRTVLALANGRVIVAVTPDRGVLLDARTALDMLEEATILVRDRCMLVINKWTGGAGLSQDEIAGFVGLSRVCTVPLEPSGLFFLAVNRGEPLLSMDLDNPIAQSQDDGGSTLYHQYRTRQVVEALAELAGGISGSVKEEL